MQASPNRPENLGMWCCDGTISANGVWTSVRMSKAGAGRVDPALLWQRLVCKGARFEWHAQKHSAHLPKMHRQSSLCSLLDMTAASTVSTFCADRLSPCKSTLGSLNNKIFQLADECFAAEGELPGHVSRCQLQVHRSHGAYATI